MDVIAVIGAGQNSGKTTAVEELLKEFKKRGLRVGTIKQIHEKSFTIDRRGKDTWRHMKAGAEIVVAASPNEVAAIKKINGGNRFHESLRLLGGQELDLLIVEGHPGVDVPMVYAARDEENSKGKPVDINAICILSLTPENFRKGGLPIYHMKKEIPRVADLILEKVVTERGGQASKIRGNKAR